MKPLTDDWLDLIITWESGISHDTVVRLVADLRAARADRDAWRRRYENEVPQLVEIANTSRADLANIKGAVPQLANRAERAEAALARVRELCAETDLSFTQAMLADRVLAAIEEEQT